MPNPILDKLGRSIEVAPQPIVETRNLFISELLDVYHQEMGRDPIEVRIVNYNGRFTSEADLVIKGFGERGIHCEFIDLRELKREAGHITHRGAQIDLVYNKWDLRDLVQCPDATDYLRAVAAGEVLSVNPLASQWIYADKSILALLSDPRFSDHFSPADRQLFRQHIPWTRIVGPGRSVSMQGEAVELCDYIKRNRTQLLLKPTNATWGDGILIGSKTGESVWDKAVDAAASGQSFVAQEYIQGHVVHCPDPTTGEITPRIADLNTFIFGGRIAGFLSRANQSPIMSLYKGGAMLPVMIAQH
jgi:diaminobutyrate-2-oxoglutarate transaminase